MYSILKTRKTKLVHKKYSAVLTSIFLTDFHVLFTLANHTYMVFTLSLQHDSHHQSIIISQGKTQGMVTHCKRISCGKAIMITKNCSKIYELTLKQDQQASIVQLEKGPFAKMLDAQGMQNSILNSIGCQIRLHAFLNHNFLIEFTIFDDHKVILDAYKCKDTKEAQYEIETFQIDLKISGSYISEVCDQNQGQFVIYKQQQIEDVQWQLRFIKPFKQQNQDKECVIILPHQKFPQQTSLVQITRWFQNTYLIISCVPNTSKLTAHLLSNKQNIQTIESYHNFNFFTEQINFISILYADQEKQIFYALTHTHERMAGQLYENGLIIGNMKTGQIIEKGELSYKNIDLSPNFRYILDVPTQYESYGEIFFHVRLLLSKSSLYMFMMEHTFMADISTSLKQAIVNLL